MSGRSVECELKIPVADLAEVCDELRAAGAVPLGQSGREVNVLFDTPERSLAVSGQALRLRRFSGSWIMTFKGPVSYRGRVKEREEVELEVEDGQALADILQRLGLSPAVRYEKDRQLWRLGEVEVALDHTPIGDFVELEGRREALDEVALSLGLDPTQAVRSSYLALWEGFRNSHRGDDLPRDMLFDP